MLRRLMQALLALAICLDMSAQTAIMFLPFVLFGTAINPRWTISGQCGKLAAHGLPWLADLIDDIPCFGPGHCARAYAFDAKFSAIAS